MLGSPEEMPCIPDMDSLPDMEMGEVGEMDSLPDVEMGDMESLPDMPDSDELPPPMDDLPDMVWPLPAPAPTHLFSRVSCRVGCLVHFSVSLACARRTPTGLR